MATTSEIHDSLLLRIRDPADRDAWYEFVAVYRPLIYRVGRRYGLQDADAQNLVQDVLWKVERHVADSVCSADESSPTLDEEARLAFPGFRGWLATVARNAAIDAIRRIKPDSARGGTTVQARLNAIPGQNDATEEEFQRAMEREAFRWAARRIRAEFTDSTWDAFWQTMVDGRTCSAVADELDKKVGAVYTARSRVMQRLKEELQEFNWQDLSGQLPSDPSASADGRTGESQP